MPYLITTRHFVAGNPPVGPVVDSRVAVATLDEAKDAARGIACGAGMPSGFGGYSRDVDVRMVQYGLIREKISKLTKPGTIGPLPDGSVITIELVRWDDLSNGEHDGPRGRRWAAQAIAAYNEAQAS